MMIIVKHGTPINNYVIFCTPLFSNCLICNYNCFNTIYDIKKELKTRMRFVYDKKGSVYICLEGCFVLTYCYNLLV